MISPLPKSIFIQRIHILLPFFLLCAGMYFVPIQILQPDLLKIPGDLGDTRFNNFILEHGFRYLTCQESRYWDARFMFPYPNVIALSDNLLGTVPIYSIFRITGFDRETSFQFWFLSMFALNFICCYLALKLWSGNTILASTGAYVFAFSVFLISHLNHLQTLPRFVTPFVFYWFYKYIITGKTRYFFFTGLGIIYQLYCGMYLGMFLLIALFTFLMSYVIVFRKFPFYFLKGNWQLFILHVLIVLSFIVLLLPLLLHYTNSNVNLGTKSFSDVSDLLPHLRSYFFANKASITWKILSDHGMNIFSTWWNQLLFTGITPWIGILFLPFALVSKYISKSQKQFVIFLWLGFLLNILVYIQIGNFTFYKFLYKLPFFGSLRDIVRMIHVQVYLLILCFVFTFNLVARHNKIARYLLFALPVLVVFDNLIDPAWINRLNKPDVQERTLHLEKSISTHMNKNYNAVAYTPLIFDKTSSYIVQLDAMIACQNAQVPCINAYTGNFPAEYYGFFTKPDWHNLESWIEFSNLNVDSILVLDEFGFSELKREHVYLKTLDDLYLSADHDHNIYADKDHGFLWESFLLVKIGTDRWMIKTYTDSFLMVDESQGSILKYYDGFPGLRGIFEIIETNDGFVKIKCFNNKFLVPDPGSKHVYATSDGIMANVRFWKIPL